ncbi:MAG: T9SS type A sorting domain-containing protein [candidate division WOR-3 bacterium]
MLNIVLSVLMLTGLPKVKALLENTGPYEEPGKINENTPNVQVLSEGYPGGTNGSWRVSVLQGEGHNNIAVINDTIVVVAFSKATTDATFYMQGLTLYYSLDGGQTFTGQYDIDVTPTARTYPDTYYDRLTGNLWVVSQIYPVGGTAARKILVVKDENVPEFGGGMTTPYYFDVNMFGPSIVAKGDTVVWIASSNTTGNFEGFRSFDGGETWEPITCAIDQSTYQPDLLLVGENTLVIAAINYTGNTMDYPYFWVSYDWGETWNGPDSILPTPYTEYNFTSWWYDASTIAWNNKVYWFGNYGEAGYEGGMLWLFTYDPFQRTIEESLVHGTAIPIIDTLTGDTTGWGTGLPYSVIPCAAKTLDERYLMVFYLDVLEEGGYGIKFRYTEDGVNWTDPVEAFPAGEDYNTRFEIQPHVPVLYTDEAVTFRYYFLGGYSGNNYINLLWLPGTQTVGIREKRPSEMFVVRPTVITGNMKIEFALSKNSNVEVQVYNAAGQKVADLYKGTLNAGSHRLTFDANFGKGIYFVTVTVDGKSTSRKILVK